MSVIFFFFFKQKTAYEMRISDWSSDVCSSDLPVAIGADRIQRGAVLLHEDAACRAARERFIAKRARPREEIADAQPLEGADPAQQHGKERFAGAIRSEEHTSELQSLMRISYAVFCLKKKQQNEFKYNNIKDTHKHV